MSVSAQEYQKDPIRAEANFKMAAIYKATKDLKYLNGLFRTVETRGRRDLLANLIKAAIDALGRNKDETKSFDGKDLAIITLASIRAEGIFIAEKTDYIAWRYAGHLESRISVARDLSSRGTTQDDVTTIMISLPLMAKRIDPGIPIPQDEIRNANNALLTMKKAFEQLENAAKIYDTAKRTKPGPDNPYSPRSVPVNRMADS